MEAIFAAWGRILSGHTPAMSIEITRECPLRCPGCYAYGDDHLGGEFTLRQVRGGGASALPKGMSEAEVFERLAALAARNEDAERQACFVGAGMYDHYVPSIVDAIAQRSEFLTPYTPYQPEISQGGLQVMFEFQTAISELTGLPVSNASVYEGPSAVAAAGYLALLTNKRSRFVVSRGLHPHSIETLRTYAAGYDAEVVEVGLADGVTDASAWREAATRSHRRHARTTRST